MTLHLLFPSIFLQVISSFMISCVWCLELYLMSFLICEKHGKWEKAGPKVAVNGYICMNRYCPDSFKVFCAACKNDHRDHSIKILNIEDVGFLVERLLKAPFREAGRVVGESLDIMKKLKLIKEFRKKIDILEKEVQRQALQLIDQTEVLVQEYTLSRQSVTRLAEMFASLEQPEVYQAFTATSCELLANLDYNFKKDKFELGNGVIKEREDKRRKSVERAKRKIEEVRDYSMKIIQVILHNDDSEDEEEDISYKRKHYDLLKAELSLEKKDHQLQQEISELKNSSINRSRLRRENAQIEVQTEQKVISVEESELRLDEAKETWKKENYEPLARLQVVQGQIYALRMELSKQKQNYNEKVKQWSQLESKLRRNRNARNEKQHLKTEIVSRIIEFSQTKSMANDEKD